VQSRIPVAIVMSAVVVGLAGADFWFKERPRLQEQLQAGSQASSNGTNDPSGTPTVEPGPDSLPVVPGTSGQSSSRRAVKKGQSTKKRETIDVSTAFGAAGLERQQTREVSLLQITSPTNVLVNTTVLLENNDRAMLFAWLDSPDAKSIFADLKENLQATFSPQVRDLVDQTLTPEDGAVTDVLSFVDPALSTEQIIFARTRTRVYEIHVSRGKEAIATKLISELAK
jgi:hypothetical protein